MKRSNAASSFESGLVLLGCLLVVEFLICHLWMPTGSQGLAMSYLMVEKRFDNAAGYMDPVVAAILRCNLAIFVFAVLSLFLPISKVSDLHRKLLMRQAGAKSPNTRLFSLFLIVVGGGFAFLSFVGFEENRCTMTESVLFFCSPLTSTQVWKNALHLFGLYSCIYFLRTFSSNFAKRST